MSFGGQQNSNEVHLMQLQSWFNMMAGNPQQVGGQAIDAKSATAATLLQQNAGIGLEDMKDLVYQFGGERRPQAGVVLPHRSDAQRAADPPRADAAAVHHGAAGADHGRAVDACRTFR
jgi:hypothetical protein